MKTCNKCAKELPASEFAKNQYKCKQCDSEYYLAHREEKLAQRKAWRETHLGYWRDLDPVRDKTPERRHVRDLKNHRRRIWAQSSGRGYTRLEWLPKLQQFRYKCYICGNDWQEKDHITPLSRGGSNEIENLAPICRSCNSSKCNATLEEFLAWRANADTQTQSWRARKSLAGPV